MKLSVKILGKYQTQLNSSHIVSSCLTNKNHFSAAPITAAPNLEFQGKGWSWSDKGSWLEKWTMNEDAIPCISYSKMDILRLLTIAMLVYSKERNQSQFPCTWSICEESVEYLDITGNRGWIWVKVKKTYPVRGFNSSETKNTSQIWNLLPQQTDTLPETNSQSTWK